MVFGILFFILGVASYKPGTELEGWLFCVMGLVFLVVGIYGSRKKSRYSSLSNKSSGSAPVG